MRIPSLRSVACLALVACAEPFDERAEWERDDTVSYRCAPSEAPAAKRCFPAVRVETESFPVLTVGGRPIRPTLVALAADGARDTVRWRHASSSDSMVARLHGDSIVPVGAGQTTLTVHAGGLNVPLHVTVVEVVAHDSLALAPGEFRTWRLGKGRYEITMDSIGPSADFRGLELTAEGTRCARDGRTGSRVHCLVADTAAVGVRNRLGAAGGVQRAELWIVRAP